MPISRLELLALFLQITNEATVVAQALSDPFLSDAAGAAALAAGRQMGLSDEQVLAMQRDMFEIRMGGPPGLRVVPDLEGPSTAIKLRIEAHDPADDHRAVDRTRPTSWRQ